MFGIGVINEYIVKAKCYHNTLGLLHEGETVTLYKRWSGWIWYDYFNSLFEPVGDGPQK